MAKTAIEKRDGAPAPHVEEQREGKGGYPPGRMLIASPLEVQDVLLRVPRGRVLRMGDLRATLATKFNADYTCALTTGIFLRIVAEAALEERGGAGPKVPYWRAVRDDGELVDKLPGGVAAQAGLLETEGVHVLHLGKRVVVSNVEHYAWVPPPQRRRSAPVRGPSATPPAANPVPPAPPRQAATSNPPHRKSKSRA